MNHVYEYTKDVLLDPHKFFKKVHSEKGMRKQFIFITVFALISFIFLTYSYVQELNRYIEMLNRFMGVEMDAFEMTFMTYLLIYGFLVVLYIVLSFLRYWITHWFVLLFKGVHGYQQTYKAMVYTLAPEYLTAPLMALFALLFVLPKSALVILLLILTGVPMLGLMLYQVYLRTVGLSKLQGISYVESFLSIYILGFILQLIIVTVAEVLLILVFFGLYMAFTAF
jgi:hypothetical protein